jgi:hypothetical protein
MEIISYILSDHNGIQLEISSKRNNKNYSIMWSLYNTMWSDHRVIEEKRRKSTNFLESNENGNTTHQNHWDKAKVVLIGKFIAISANI